MTDKATYTKCNVISRPELIVQTQNNAQDLPRILFYERKPHKEKLGRSETITPKKTFSTGENGIFGFFEEYFGFFENHSSDSSFSKYALIVFTSETIFDSEATGPLDYHETMPNHRFHRFLKINVPFLPNKPSGDFQFKSKGFNGGQVGHYRMENDILTLGITNPYNKIINKNVQSEFGNLLHKMGLIQSGNFRFEK